LGSERENVRHEGLKAMSAMSEWDIERHELASRPYSSKPQEGELNWNDIHKLTKGGIGNFSLSCPYCAPGKFSSTRFRIERPSLSWAKYNCFYCGVEGELKGDGVSPEAEEAAQAAYRAQQAADREEKTARALAIWEAGSPIAGTPAHEYLKARSIFDLPPDVDQVLRFHPLCPFGRQGLRPCMLALFRSIKSNKPLAVHRTLFFRDGTAQRMALGPIGGAAIKLWPKSDERLTIGEGIETVLSAALYLRRADGSPLRPAWSLTVAKSLRHFPVIPGIERLSILADNDESQVGQSAAKACAQRWADAERKATVLYPEGKDFNDDIRGRR
jgi:hypothetical protein